MSCLEDLELTDHKVICGHGEDFHVGKMQFAKKNDPENRESAYSKSILIYNDKITIGISLRKPTSTLSLEDLL
ncbi:hypothetical protein [Bartonella sp. B17]